MKESIYILYAKSTSELLNRQSALGSYIHCLASLLKKNGYEIWLNHIPFDELPANIPASIPAPAKSGLGKFFPDFVKNIKRNQRTFAAHEDLFQKIKQNFSGKIILEFYTYGSDLGLRLKKTFQCPLVVVFDSPVLEEFEFFNGKVLVDRKKITQRQNETLKSADQLVVYSNAVKEYVTRITGKINNINIHQNVDFTRFDFIPPRPVTDEINIGFIGSFLTWHRVDLLLKVFERIRAEKINARLWLVGSGQQFPQIQKMVDESPCKSFITLPGFCDGEKLLQIKQVLQIGVMPGSNWYGAPNKIFEYGAAGLAVMAPSTPTIRNLFQNGKEVLLFEWDNEQSAYETLKRLCTDQSLLQQLQLGLQEKIRNTYSETNTVNFYTQLLNASLT